MEKKEGGCTGPGLYLLQLRWITKLLPWANHSKRLTNTTTEPIILDTEIGNWYLLEERERIRGKGSFLTPTCSLGKAAFPYVLLFLLFSPSIKRQPNPLWETAMGRLLPEQTEGVTVCPGGVNKCQECLTQEGADDLCVEGGGGGCWGGGRGFLEWVSPKWTSEML